MARTQQALRNLTIQFQRREVEKEYIALLHGTMTADRFEWAAPVGRRQAGAPYWLITPEGRAAHSRGRTVRRLKGFTLAELQPVTGRTNQLRLHASWFGHPIAGDLLFGPTGLPEPRQLPPCPAERVFLHAAALSFRHPVDGRSMRIRSPLPAELSHLLDQLA